MKLLGETLEDQIFTSILLMAIALSLASIIWNTMIGFPFQVNYKWIFLLCWTLITMKLARCRIPAQWIRLIFFMLVIFFILPMGWINSGGINTYTIAYIFLICIGTSFLFRGTIRSFLIFSLIVVFVTLIIVEHILPDIVEHYDPNIRFRDMLVQVPLTVSLAYIFLKVYTDAYEKEKQKLEEYSNQLHAANEKLLRISRTDSLTQVYNRDYIFRELKQGLRRICETGDSFYLLMMDVDDFKNINDKYGHLVGDDTLIQISEILRTTFDKIGIVGRYGGDEFIVLLKCSEHQAVQKAKEAVTQIESKMIVEEFVVTISGGLVRCTHERGLISIVKEADELLYQAKNSGKNMICYWSYKDEDICGC